MSVIASQITCNSLFIQHHAQRKLNVTGGFPLKTTSKKSGWFHTPKGILIQPSLEIHIDFINIDTTQNHYLF